MDDFVKVQIIHPTCNPCGPIHKQPRGDFPPCSQDFIELSMCTVLHDNTVAWGLSANSPVKGNTQLVRISEVKVPEQLSKVAIKGQENNLFTLPGKPLLIPPYWTGRGTFPTCFTQEEPHWWQGWVSFNFHTCRSVGFTVCILWACMQSAALGGNGVHSCLGFFVFFVGGGGGCP